MTSTLDFIVPEDRERLKELRKAMLASEEGRVTCEVRSLNSAGETLHLVCHSARVPWDDGWATCVHLHDISEQKKAEEHLHHAQRMETVGQLSGGIAHDFNNILTVIQGNLELMEETLEVTGDSSLLDMGRSAIRASQRGADLTRRLLAFSRRQVLEREVLDVNTIVDSVCEMLDRTVGENIKVVKIPSETLPLVKTDRSQLENALLNLAVNARDAMPSGGRIVFETTVCELTSDYTDNRSEVEPGWYVLVSVSDNGVGIPQDVLPKVMEPFFTTKSVGKGTGLGLSTIFGFLKQARGHLAIYSEENQGTTVKVYLPIEEVEALPDEQEIPKISQTSDNRKTVLIVEDNEDVQSIANAMISAMGLDVVLAGSGPEALDILRQHDDIDLIFTDVVMPGGMNGVEIAREARVLRPGIQILYTSGYAEGALKNSEDKQLDAEWIAKPYSRDALIRKISFLLNGST